MILCLFFYLQERIGSKKDYQSNQHSLNQMHSMLVLPSFYLEYIIGLETKVKKHLKMHYHRIDHKLDYKQPLRLLSKQLRI